MNDIKYRQFYPAKDINGTQVGNRFHYWGYVYPEHPDAFVSPLSGDGIKPSQEFTRLKDKNGVDIFEGDILRERDEVAHPFVESKDYTVDRLHEVRYLTGNKDDGFRCVSQPTPYYTGDKYYVTWIDPRTMEVVGNIYQNSELLKAGTL